MRHGGNVWDCETPEKWLDFSANLRPEGTPDWVMDVMQQALADARYYPDRAMKAARRGLAAYAGMSEECILPTAGGAQAIDLVLGDGTGRVCIQQPTFIEYSERAMAHGRKVCTKMNDIRPGDTVVRCNPNNPTGAVMTRGDMLTFADQVRARDAELMVDEAFIDFCEENSVRRDVCEGLTVVGSLTKTLCIPGVRLGYVCASPERIARLEKQMLTWSLNVLANAVAAALPEHLDEMRADVRKNLFRVRKMQTLLCEAGVTPMPTRANFLLCDFGEDTTPLVSYLKEQHILVRTCASFGLGSNWLRLAVKTDEENARLVSAIAAWKEKNHAR